MNKAKKCFILCSIFSVLLLFFLSGGGGEACAYFEESRRCRNESNGGGVIEGLIVQEIGHFGRRAL